MSRLPSAYSASQRYGDDDEEYRAFCAERAASRRAPTTTSTTTRDEARLQDNMAYFGARSGLSRDYIYGRRPIDKIQEELRDARERMDSIERNLKILSLEAEIDKRQRVLDAAAAVDAAETARQRRKTAEFQQGLEYLESFGPQPNGLDYSAGPEVPQPRHGHHERSHAGKKHRRGPAIGSSYVRGGDGYEEGYTPQPQSHSRSRSHHHHPPQAPYFPPGGFPPPGSYAPGPAAYGPSPYPESAHTSRTYGQAPPGFAHGQPMHHQAPGSQYEHTGSERRAGRSGKTKHRKEVDVHNVHEVDSDGETILQ